ncbi:hypothetical protein [Nocardioides lentus]
MHGDAGGSWRRSVDRVVLVGGAFVAGAHVAGTVLALALSGRGLLTTSGAAWAVLLVSQVALVALCLRERRRGPGGASGAVAVAVAGVSLVSACLVARDPALAAFAVQLLPVNALQNVMLAPVAFASSARVTLVVVGVAGVLHVVLRGATVDLGPFGGLDEWVLPAGMALSIWAVVGHLRSAAESADRAFGRGSRLTAERSDRANAELALEATRRVVHDDVISALSAVELGLPEAERRRACRAALAALSDTDGVADVRALTDRLRAGSTLRLDVDDSDWGAAPPPRVLGALRGAIGEALRNAARHGDALSARVELRSSADRAAATVTDDGAGLAPGWQPGFGIRRSIVGRMREVGGAAYVGPSPSGPGAEVRLVWPEARGLDPLSGRRSLWDYGRAVRTIAVIPAVTNSYLFLRYPGEQPPVSLAVLLGLGLVLVAVVRRTTAREGFGPTLLVGLVVAVCGLTWLGLVAAGPQTLYSVESWVVGAGANVLCIVAFQVAPRAGVLMAVAQVATVVAFAAVAPGIGPLDPAGALLTPLTVIGVGIVFGTGVRRSERRMARLVETLTRQREVSAWSRSFAESRRVRLAHLEDAVVPFLRGVATGTGPADPERARVLAARCRDDLYLTRPLDPATRAAVDDARARGTGVAIRAVEEDSPDLPMAAWRLLRAVLLATDPDHRVTVLPATADEPARLVVVPPLDQDPPDAEGHRDATRSTYVVSPDRPTSRS